ncbi:Serine/threonine-protein kinase ATR, partial [Tetrabaena socialis]
SPSGSSGGGPAAAAAAAAALALTEAEGLSAAGSGRPARPRSSRIICCSQLASSERFDSPAEGAGGWVLGCRLLRRSPHLLSASPRPRPAAPPQVPEMVPFRLTQNVIDCFGISGVEGAYRRCAETTLQVLRQHKETLMTCAETFLHDPLLEWAGSGSSRGGQRGAQDANEAENPAAKDALATIEGRLGGTLLGVAAVPSLPLSCEGQAARLISEATDKENLGRMYVWWMAWY